MRTVYSTDELTALIAAGRLSLGDRARRTGVCIVDGCNARHWPSDGTNYGRIVLARTKGDKEHGPRWHDIGAACHRCTLEIRTRLQPGGIVLREVPGKGTQKPPRRIRRRAHS